MKSARKEMIDGQEYFIVLRDVTMDSHPAYTGETRLVASAGRGEKFTPQFKGSTTKSAQAILKLICFDCDSALSSLEGIDELARLRGAEVFAHVEALTDRKSTRLNSSHLVISSAVFCLNK